MSFDGKGFLKEIKNVAVNKATAKVTSLVGDKLGLDLSTKLPGDIGKNFGDVLSDPFAKAKQNPFEGETVMYPEDLGYTDQSHYVQFFINEQVNAHVDFGGTTALSVAQARQLGTTTGEIVRGLQDETEDRQKEITEGFNPTPTAKDRYTAPSTLSVPRAPTRRLASSIAMYMPATVSVAQTSNYGEVEIGGATSAAIAAGKGFNNDFRGVLASRILAALEESGNVGRESAPEMGKAALDTAFSGAKAAIDINRGKITNNRMEMIFEGTSRREFNFAFKMMPKSENEANLVAKIVKMFRFYMAPSFDGPIDVRRTMIVPATFDIKYMVKQKENSYLNKISTSVLTSCNVVYGGERTQFFRPNEKGAPPVETSIELTFKELEVITRERINAGF